MSVIIKTPFILILLNFFVYNFLAAAVPLVSDADGLADGVNTLEPRQLLIANPSVACCTDCSSAYSYDTFWNVFNDFCTWAGNGLELWTSQSYNTGNYYCKDGADVCIHLLVKYECGGGSAFSVTYSGCMSYFIFAVNPAGICGGPPYPGARIKSKDKCWIFQATADTSATAVSKTALVCDDSGRYCHLPGSNDAAPVLSHTFGSAHVASD